MESSGLAGFGVYLLLAFIIPGFCYMFVLGLLYPDQITNQIHFFSGKSREKHQAEGYSPVLITGLGIVVGLLISSVTFFVELLCGYLWPFFKDYLFPGMEVGRIAFAEAEGKNTIYLQMLSGSALMHFNVGFGIFLIVLLYTMASLKHRNSIPKFWRLPILFMIVAIANLGDAHYLYCKVGQIIHHVVQLPTPRDSEIPKSH